MKPVLATSAPLPFLSHRTLAEVDETGRLAKLEQEGTLTPQEAERLRYLRRKRAMVKGGVRA